jgi:hypothetical protein
VVIAVRIGPSAGPDFRQSSAGAGPRYLIQTDAHDGHEPLPFTPRMQPPVSPSPTRADNALVWQCTHLGTSHMLQPAHVGHLALLRSLIRQGAADGSFDRDLAVDSPGAEEFFAKLKRALVTG